MTGLDLYNRFRTDLSKMGSTEKMDAYKFDFSGATKEDIKECVECAKINMKDIPRLRELFTTSTEIEWDLIIYYDELIITNCEKQEDKKMTLPVIENKDAVRFEFNGVVYRQKDAKGTYCYKDGQRIPYKKFEEVYAEYRQTDAYKAEQEVKPAKTKGASKPRTKAAFEKEFDGVQVRLTEKQVSFIKEMPNDDFYERGLDSTLWIEIFCDTVAGIFNPMAVGAMVSTLREKGIILVDEQKMDGRKCKYMAFTALGKQVAKELGIK